MVTLLHEKDGQVDLYETWDLDDIEVANARFEKLAAGDAAASHESEAGDLAID